MIIQQYFIPKLRNRLFHYNMIGTIEGLFVPLWVTRKYCSIIKISSVTSIFWSDMHQSLLSSALLSFRCRHLLGSRENLNHGGYINPHQRQRISHIVESSNNLVVPVDVSLFVWWASVSKRVKKVALHYFIDYSVQ